MTDAATGAPLADVSVRVYNASGSSVGSNVTTNASGVYTTSTGLPAGTYYVRTTNSLGYIDELYDNLPCPGGSCSVTSGTGVSVTAGATTGGINFGLAVGGRIYGDGDGCGDGRAAGSVAVYLLNASGNYISLRLYGRLGGVHASTGCRQARITCVTWIGSGGYCG